MCEVNLVCEENFETLLISENIKNNETIIFSLFVTFPWIWTEQTQFEEDHCKIFAV